MGKGIKNPLHILGKADNVSLDCSLQCLAITHPIERELEDVAAGTNASNEALLNNGGLREVGKGHAEIQVVCQGKLGEFSPAQGSQARGTQIHPLFNRTIWHVLDLNAIWVKKITTIQGPCVCEMKLE